MGKNANKNGKKEVSEKTPSEGSVRGNIKSITDSLKEQNSQMAKEMNDIAEINVASNFILTNISKNIADTTEGILSLPKLITDLTDATNDNSVHSNFILTNIAKNIADMTEGVIGVSDILSNDHMKELESARENAKRQDDMLLALQKLQPKKEEKKEEEKSSFNIIGLFGSLVAGLITGGVAFIATYVAEYVKMWKKFIGKFKIGEQLEQLAAFIVEKWTTMKKFVSESLVRMWESVVGFFKENKIVKGIVNFFEEVWGAVKSFFKVDEIIPELKNMWTALKEIFAGPAEMIGKFFGKGGSSIIDEVLKFFSFLKPITGFFKSLGVVLGKLAVPLQVIMSIWDTVSGALDGWNKTEGSFIDKFFGALKGGLTGLLNGLFGGVADLFKDAISWVLGFFGFKDAAAWLDSFSFSQIIEDTIGTVIDGIKGIVMGIVDVWNTLKEKFSNIDWGDMIKKGLAWLIVGITAAANTLTSALGFDLTKKALDLAGLEDPRSGGGSSASSSGSASAGLSSATSDNTSVKADGATKAAEAASTTAAVSGGNKSTVVNNAGTTAVITGKTRSVDNEDMWARGMMA